MPPDPLREPQTGCVSLVYVVIGTTDSKTTTELPSAPTVILLSTSMQGVVSHSPEPPTPLARRLIR
jgi:hypothetical protein